MMSPYKKNIIFDLDETLLHTFDDMVHYDLYKDDEFFKKYIYKLDFGDYEMWGFYRPYLKLMLNNIINIYDISVWSAGTKDYVNNLSKNIFNDIPLKFIWCRDKCYNYYDIHDNYNYLKKPISKVFDNHKFMNYDNTIIIDDRYDVSSDNIFNHIHVPKYNFRNIDMNDKQQVYKYIYDDDVIKKLNNHLIINNNKNIRTLSNIYF